MHITTGRTEGTDRLRGLIAVSATMLFLLIATSCKSTDSVASGSPVPRGSSSESARPTTTAPGSPDASLAAAALLEPNDIPVGSGWAIGTPDLDFPNSATLAAKAPACTDFADVVFRGGARHGTGESRVLFRGTDPVFNYVAIFPNEADAKEMSAAVARPGFDQCWLDFNVLAEKNLPDVSGASYKSVPPPQLSITADDVDVEALSGTVVQSGSTFEDTCICVFARVGRGIVEVHSPAQVLTPEERSKVVQVAVDKLRAALAAG